MKNKAIVFAPASGIEESIVKRFLDINRYYAPWYIDVKVHTSEPTKDPYNLAIAMNNAVKEYSSDYEVIMKTDVDMIISPHLMIAAYERTRTSDSAMRSWCRYCEEDDPLIQNPEKIPWSLVAGLEPKEANGTFMSMNSGTWLKSGGYAECCWGWGGEDNAFVEKATRMFKMHVAKLYPILHIKHEQRDWKTSMPRVTAKNNYKRALAYYDRNWLKRPLSEKEKDVILG